MFENFTKFRFQFTCPYFASKLRPMHQNNVCMLRQKYFLIYLHNVRFWAEMSGSGSNEFVTEGNDLQDLGKNKLWGKCNKNSWGKWEADDEGERENIVMREIGCSFVDVEIVGYLVRRPQSCNINNQKIHSGHSWSWLRNCDIESEFGIRIWELKSGDKLKE